MANIYDKSSLVLIPSGTKTGKIFSQKPVSGDGDFTFTRASAATRVNADGNIEKETQNLINYSNTFSTGWVQDRILSATGGQVGYDGSNDAWFVVPTNVITYHTIRQSSSQTGIVTISVYAKAETYNGILLYSSSNTNGKFFNVSNGTLGDDFGSNVIDASISDVGNGWYRCSVTLNKTGTGNVEVLLSSDGVNTYTFAGDGVGGVYIQDFQLEQGLVARDYIETTTAAVYGGITDNTPRLDYTDSSCPALLLEPQRTNLIAYSEYFNIWWSKTGSLSFTNNYAISPEGLQNASRWVSTGGAFPQMTRAISGLTIGQEYTTTFYVKSDGTSQIEQSFWISSINEVRFTPSSEWTRVTHNFTATSTSHTMVLFTNSGTAPASSYLLYGFQLEAGSYATSYIPTYGSSVSRVQDSFYNNGYQANNIFGTNSGSIFFDFGDDFTIFDGVSNSSPTDLFQFVDVTSYGGGYMRFRGGETNHYLQLVSMGAADNSLSFTDQTKYCICWDSNGVDFYGNGALIQSTTITNVPSFDRLERGITGNGREGRVKEMLFFTTKLSSQEAIDLTTI